MEEEDMATVHMIFQKLGSENFDLEEVIALSEQMMNEYDPDELVYDNRRIGFENDSPILDKRLRLSTKLANLAEVTNQKYIKYDLSAWDKYKDYVTFSNVTTIAVVTTSVYLMYHHYAN
jgi:hypothetical protein